MEQRGHGLPLTPTPKSGRPVNWENEGPANPCTSTNEAADSSNEQDDPQRILERKPKGTPKRQGKQRGRKGLKKTGQVIGGMQAQTQPRHSHSTSSLVEHHPKILPSAEGRQDGFPRTGTGKQNGENAKTSERELDHRWAQSSQEPPKPSRQRSIMEFMENGNPREGERTPPLVPDVLNPDPNENEGTQVGANPESYCLDQREENADEPQEK